MAWPFRELNCHTWYITLLHDSQLGHFKNIKALISIIWDAEVLALRLEVIYELCHYDGLKWNDIHTNFLNKDSRNASSTKVVIPTVWNVAALNSYQISWRLIWAIKVCWGVGNTDLHTRRATWSHKLTFFFRKKKYRLIFFINCFSIFLGFSFMFIILSKCVLFIYSY